MSDIKIPAAHKLALVVFVPGPLTFAEREDVRNAVRAEISERFELPVQIRILEPGVQISLTGKKQ